MVSHRILDNITDIIGKYYGVLPTILLIAYGLIFMGVSTLILNIYICLKP